MSLPVWTRPRRLSRRWAIPLHVLAGLFALVSLVGALSHLQTPTVTWRLALAAFAPYLMVWCLPAFAVWAVMRQWVLAALAFVLVVITGVTQVPLFIGADAPGNSTTITVMTANLRLGFGEPSSVIDAVRDRHVDLLAVEELTPEALAGLDGLSELLPYHETAADNAGFGTGLWSRYPLTSLQSRDDFGFHLITGRMRVPGLPTIGVAAVHMCGPYPQAACWVHDIDRLPIVLRELTRDRTVLVAGDFNATPDVAQFRALLTDGYADATQQSGSGWLPTYPANRWYPPLIPIDHVLTRHAVATGADRVDLTNSDHLGLIVTVAVRP